MYVKTHELKYLALTNWPLKNPIIYFNLYSFPFHRNILLSFKKLVSTINKFYIPIFFVLKVQKNRFCWLSIPNFTRKTLYVYVVQGKIKRKNYQYVLRFLVSWQPWHYSFSTLLLIPVTDHQKKKQPNKKRQPPSGFAVFYKLSKKTVIGSITKKKKSCSGVDKFICKEK